MRANVAFPNGMVDRITPATTERERRCCCSSRVRHRRQLAGVLRAFRQWVLEDTFTAGRPASKRSGVQFVADVAPFELMKIRILNGGHATIAYPAGADGHPLRARGDAGSAGARLPAEAARRKRSSRSCRRCRTPSSTITTTLIEARFSNPKIGDTIRRLCLDGSNRQPKFILPSIADRLRAGLSVDGLALESRALVPLLLRRNRDPAR